MHLDIQLHTNKICPLPLMPTSLWSCVINVKVEPEEDTLVLTNETDGSRYKKIHHSLAELHIHDLSNAQNVRISRVKFDTSKIKACLHAKPISLLTKLLHAVTFL